MVAEKILCSQAEEPQGGMGGGVVQGGEDVGDEKRGRIEDHVGGMEGGLGKGKDFAGGGKRLVGGAHVQAERARQKAVEILREQMEVAPSS